MLRRHANTDLEEQVRDIDEEQEDGSSTGDYLEPVVPVGIEVAEPKLHLCLVESVSAGNGDSGAISVNSAVRLSAVVCGRDDQGYQSSGRPQLTRSSCQMIGRRAENVFQK